MAESILEEAQRLIHGERNKNYGHPRENFADIAALFSAYLEKEITDLDVANLMILMKIARVKGTGYHRDSYTDMAGYAGCAERIYEEPHDGLYNGGVVNVHFYEDDLEEYSDLDDVAPNRVRVVNGVRQLKYLNDNAPEDITMVRDPEGWVWRRISGQWICDNPDKTVHSTWTGWYTVVVPQQT